jgi:mitochondrial fission protein ELM1
LTKERPLRIWALIGVRPGDNDQVVALAEALGLPFEVKRLEYNALCHLGPRLLGRSTASLTSSSRKTLLCAEPPDLTISAGHRSVPAVQELRHRSKRRVRSVHVGFPRISTTKFDLVIATPQYPIDDQPNLLRIPYALTRAATADADPGDKALLKDLPGPRRLLIVGGPTLFWRIDDHALLGTLDNLLDEATQDGGSVLVTSSPRTPSALKEKIAGRLAGRDVPTVLAVPGERPAYSSLLEIADQIRVTADSVSMVSDAIWTGKPIALVPVVKSTAGRLYFALMDKLRPGRPVYPQDLRFFWSALAKIGVGKLLGTPKASTDEIMGTVLDTVRAQLRTRT